MTERLLLLADGDVQASTMRLALPAVAMEEAVPGAGGTLAERVEGYERSVILSELKRHDYRMTDTARALGLERSHLYKKCQQLGIERDRRE